ncbi:hypothetical protein C8Q80DRAFT_1211166 [Daedaleopsis nitida]|nr:hypothetical protein C8Q80DRAFT_1211166 [Daedaleopsis nitida]
MKRQRERPGAGMQQQGGPSAGTQRQGRPFPGMQQPESYGMVTALPVCWREPADVCGSGDAARDRNVHAGIVESRSEGWQRRRQHR